MYTRSSKVILDKGTVGAYCLNCLIDKCIGGLEIVIYNRVWKSAFCELTGIFGKRDLSESLQKHFPISQTRLLFYIYSNMIKTFKIHLLFSQVSIVYHHNVDNNCMFFYSGKNIIENSRWGYMLKCQYENSKIIQFPHM